MTLFQQPLNAASSFNLGQAEVIDHHLSCRLGKMVPNCYRLVSFIAIVEIAWVIVEEHLLRFRSFPIDGECSMEFVDRVQSLFEEIYHDQCTNGRPYMIAKDVVDRGLNVVAGNIEQYKLLMYIPVPESALRLLSVLQQPTRQRSHVRSIEEQNRDKMLVIERVLLFDSLAFTATTLHLDSFIRHHSSYIASALHDLTNSQLLIRIQKGIQGARKPTPVYVKQMPDIGSSVSLAKFHVQLAQLGNNRITLKSIEDRSKRIVLRAKGSVEQSVFDCLDSSNYAHLQLDSSCLKQITPEKGKQRLDFVSRSRVKSNCFSYLDRLAG